MPTSSQVRRGLVSGDFCSSIVVAPQSAHTTCSKRKKSQPSRPAQTTVSTKPNATSTAGNCLISFRYSFGWPSIVMRARVYAVCRLPSKVLARRCRQVKGSVKQQFNKTIKIKGSQNR